MKYLSERFSNFHDGKLLQIQYNVQNLTITLKALDGDAKIEIEGRTEFKLATVTFVIEELSEFFIRQPADNQLVNVELYMEMSDGEIYLNFYPTGKSYAKNIL